MIGPVSSWIERPERRVLLGRAADRREWPDRTRAVIDPVDAEHGEVVRQAVIAKVVAERPLGFACVGIDRAADHEIGLGRHRQEPVGGDHPDPPAPQAPRRSASSGSPSGNGITAATVMAGGPPTKTFTRSGSPRRIAAAWCTPIPRWIW